MLGPIISSHIALDISEIYLGHNAYGFCAELLFGIICTMLVTKLSYREPSLLLRWAARLAVAVVFLGFTLPHVLWAFGVPFGITHAYAHQIHHEMAADVAYIGIGALMSALLVYGLASRWGQIFPGWIPLLKNRKVPPLVAIVPGLLGSALLLWYGTLMTSCVGSVVLRFHESCYDTKLTYFRDNWAFTMTYLVFFLWGLCSAVATISYIALVRKRS